MFEVGKKYKNKFNNEEFTCNYVGKKFAMLEDRNGVCCVPGLEAPYWEEVKLLTFADLKVGEEFRLQGVKDKAMCIEGGKYVYIEGLFKGQTYNIRFKECCVREHSIVERV